MPEVIMSYEFDDTGKMINLKRMEELVRCKDCKHRGDEDNCPKVFVEWVEYDDDGYIEHDDICHDQSTDNGFCECGELEDMRYDV